MIIRTAKELGALVRENRRTQKLTQSDLAARVGVSRKWLIDFEAGKRTSDLSLVLRTLNGVGIALDAQLRPAGSAAPGTELDAIIDRGRRQRR